MSASFIVITYSHVFIGEIQYLTIFKKIYPNRYKCIKFYIKDTKRRTTYERKDINKDAYFFSLDSIHTKKDLIFRMEQVRDAKIRFLSTKQFYQEYFDMFLGGQV